MDGQQGSWMWVGSDDVASFNTTVQVHNRNIFAEVALVKLYVSGNDYWYSEIGISQVVSDSGVENFDRPVYMIFRTGVTSITFHVAVYSSFTLARWMINFW